MRTEELEQTIAANKGGREAEHAGHRALTAFVHLGLGLAGSAARRSAPAMPQMGAVPAMTHSNGSPAQRSAALTVCGAAWSGRCRGWHGRGSRGWAAAA